MHLGCNKKTASIYLKVMPRLTIRKANYQSSRTPIQLFWPKIILPQPISEQI